MAERNSSEKRKIDDILPKSEIVESGYLNSMLNNFTASYKMYWFKGIFTEIMKGKSQIAYRRIVARMIASAWYPVVYYKLSLGHSDKLADTILYIHKELGVAREEKEEKIVEFVCESQDKKLSKMIKDFTNMVPYRLIRPFYQRELDRERKVNVDFADYKINAMIEQYNRDDDGHAFYILNDQDEFLTVSRVWIYYLKQNAAIIEGWMNYKLVDYLQRRNPNVPAIPFKVFPPSDKDRSLSNETKYWNDIQKEIPLYDIYTDTEFTKENLEQRGGMSIDHFIPWSFVLHNEIWNLYPMYRNVNSGKNNKLPDKDKYLESFCEKQYQAFMVAKKWEKGPRRNVAIRDQYLHVKQDIFELDGSDRGHDAFLTAMKQTIEPLYQIANNQGYMVWRA
ncbi:MAG: HNH endonuclease domain-containing protein [Lachnospiraceae bacterium]|nr:HNH endonuclease domain-containing protein [Lachnospiraceae bacterium]